MKRVVEKDDPKAWIEDYLHNKIHDDEHQLVIYRDERELIVKQSPEELVSRVFERVVKPSLLWNEILPNYLAAFHIMKDFERQSESGNIGDVFPFLPLLTSLDLSGNKVVTEENILRIKNLRMLDLTENRVVSDDTLSQLTSLTELMLCDNHLITDRGISGLSSLTQLSLMRGTLVSNRGLTCLHGLESLWIDKMNNAVLNMRGVSKLTTLKYLKTECIDVHNEVLLCLTNLTHLHIDESYIDIQPYVFEQLTRLTKLVYHVDSGSMVSSINQGLAKLHNLTYLDIRLCPCVTDDGIRHMTSLVKLFANGNITLDTYANFPNLRLLCSVTTDVVSPTHNLLTSLTYLESSYTVNPSPEHFEKFKSLKFIRLYQPLHQRHYQDSDDTMEYFKKRYMSLNYECGSRFVETH